MEWNGVELNGVEWHLLDCGRTTRQRLSQQALDDERQLALKVLGRLRNMQQSSSLSRRRAMSAGALWLRNSGDVSIGRQRPLRSSRSPAGPMQGSSSVKRSRSTASFQGVGMEKAASFRLAQGQCEPRREPGGCDFQDHWTNSRQPEWRVDVPVHKRPSSAPLPAGACRASPGAILKSHSANNLASPRHPVQPMSRATARPDIVTASALRMTDLAAPAADLPHQDLKTSGRPRVPAWAFGGIGNSSSSSVEYDVDVRQYAVSYQAVQPSLRSGVGFCHVASRATASAAAGRQALLEGKFSSCGAPIEDASFSRDCVASRVRNVREFSKHVPRTSSPAHADLRASEGAPDVAAVREAGEISQADRLVHSRPKSAPCMSRSLPRERAMQGLRIALCPRAGGSLRPSQLNSTCGFQAVARSPPTVRVYANTPKLGGPSRQRACRSDFKRTVSSSGYVKMVRSDARPTSRQQQQRIHSPLPDWEKHVTPDSLDSDAALI